MDHTCLIWGNRCGKTGNCWLYDQSKLRNYLHGFTILCLLSGNIFDFGAIFFSHRIRNFYDDDEEVEKSDDIIGDQPENRKIVEKVELNPILK